MGIMNGGDDRGRQRWAGRCVTSQGASDCAGREVRPCTVLDHRPHLRAAWEVLRATGPDDAVVVFAFLPRGGEARDWDLLTLFEEALGAEGAHCALQEMQEMMRGEQYGWSLRPVEFE
jgi:hypothetical protein